MTAAQHTRSPQARTPGKRANAAHAQTLLPPVQPVSVLITESHLLGYAPPVRSTRLPFQSAAVAPDFQVILPGHERIGAGAVPLLARLIEQGVTLHRPLTENDTPLSVLASLIRQEVGTLDHGLPVLGIDVTEEERGGGLRLNIQHHNHWEVESTWLVKALTDLGQPDLLPSMLHHIAQACSDHVRVYGSGSLGHDLHSLFDYEKVNPDLPAHQQPGYSVDEALGTYTTAFTETHNLGSEAEAEGHPDWPAYLLEFGNWCVTQELVNAATALRELPECVLRERFLAVHEINTRLGTLPAGLKRHFQTLLGHLAQLRGHAASIPAETRFEKETYHGEDLGEAMPVLLVTQCVYVPIISCLIDDAHENAMNISEEEPLRTVCLEEADDLSRAVQVVQGYARLVRTLRCAAHTLNWANHDAGTGRAHLKRTPAPELPDLYGFNSKIKADTGQFHWSVPQQEKRMSTPTASLLQPTSALVVYRHPGVEVPVVINHPVHVDGGSAVLGAGTPVSQAAMEALMSSLDAFPLGLQAENVLARGKDGLIFWERARTWRFSFDTRQPDLDRLSGRMIPMPALVFKVTHGRNMQVYALKDNARPGPDTPLFAPPTMNTGRGMVCLGNTQLPQRLDPEHPELWSAAYFRSTFTHSANAMNWQSSYGDLLRLAIKKRRFPTEHLGKTLSTLRGLVNG